MPYLPKSQYKYKTAAPNEFVYKKDKTPFLGTYFELSDGTYKEGRSFDKLGKEIVPKTTPKKDNTYKINKELGELSIQNSNVNQYNALKQDIFQDHDNFEPIVFTKPIPTEKDYKQGSFIRYFCLRANTLNDYKEINKKTYESIKNEEKKYDDKLHYVGQIEWSLLEEYANKANSTSIRKTKKSFPNVNILFPDLKEYSMPDSLLRPKTQLEKIEEQDNPPILPMGAEISTPNTRENTKLKAAQNKAIAEVIDKNKKEKKTGTLKRRKVFKEVSKRVNSGGPGLKASISHLKMFKGPKGTSSGGSSGGTSGGGGGGY